MSSEDRQVAEANQTTQYDTNSTLQRTLAKLTHLDLTGHVQYDATAMQANGGYCDVFVGTIPMQPPKDPSDTSATVPELKVAVKRMRVHIQKEREFDKLLAKELYVWSKLDHPNILPLRGFALEGAYPLVISEWMENGTVREYLQSHPQQDVRPMIVQIADAVNYLHGQDVVHSDLKADNILIDSHGEPLICDFGMSRMLSASLTMTATSTGGIKGSLRWMAYELLDIRGDSHHTKETDVWAFGMTVYEILVRKLPYAHLRSDPLVLRAIIEHNLPSCPPGYDDWHPFLKYVWTICTKCWISPPEGRITMEGVMNDLCSIKHTNVINNATTGDLSQAQSNQQGLEPAYKGVQITFVDDSDSSSSASDDDSFDQHGDTSELGNGEAEARHEEHDFDDNAYGYLANDESGYEEEAELAYDDYEASSSDDSSD